MNHKTVNNTIIAFKKWKATSNWTLLQLDRILITFPVPQHNLCESGRTYSRLSSISRAYDLSTAGCERHEPGAGHTTLETFWPRRFVSRSDVGILSHRSLL